MGYKTEINYILKSSSKLESIELNQAINSGVGSVFKITKSGLRTFVLDSPIMFADDNWKILGMCSIMSSQVDKYKTVLEAKILTIFTPEESVVVSRVIQDAEKVK